MKSSCKLTAIFIGALLCAYYWPWLSGQQSFYQSDLTYYFEPLTKYFVERFKQGHLPLWNPYLYCGMPQIAVPSPGMFYPPGAIFLLLPFSQALAFYLVIHQLVIGIGAYLLIVSLGWGLSAALVAASACSLCGYMFALTNNYTLVATAAWLPLLLYSVRTINGAWHRRNLITIAASAVCLFLLIMAGRPEISAPALLSVAFYVAMSAYGDYRRDSAAVSSIRNCFLLRTLALFSGALLASPVILPALEWVALSPRSHGLDLKWVLMWSANWYDCLLLLFPQPFGDLTYLGNKYLGLAASRPHAMPYLTSSYVGPVIFTLALWGLFDKRWRWRPYVILIFVGGLLMALGANTPVAPFVCHLSPAFAAFRYPVKLMIFPCLALILLSARGMSAAYGRTVSRVALRLVALLAGVIFILGLVFVFIPDVAVVVSHWRWLITGPVELALLQDAQKQLGYSCLIVGTVMAAVNVAYLALLRERLNGTIFAGSILLLLIVSLLVPSCLYLRHGTVANFFVRPAKLADRLRALTGGTGRQTIAARALTLYFDPLTPGTSFLSEQKMDFQSGFYLYTRHVLLPNSNVSFRVPYSYGYEAAEVGSYKQLFVDALARSSQNARDHADLGTSDGPMARFCQLTDTKYVLTQAYRHTPATKVAPLDPRFFKLRWEDPQMNVRLYEPLQLLPRVYFADHIAWNVQADGFRQLMLDTNSPQLLDKTFVEAEPLAVDNHLPVAASATFICDDPEHIILRVHCDGQRLMVLTDHFYPGWGATVDGVPAEIYQANFFARSVLVGPGEHLVEFRYNPVSLWSGLAVFALVSGLLLAAILLSRRQLPSESAKTGQ